MNQFQLVKIKKHFPDNSLKDVRNVTRQELQKLSGIIKKDTSIAIGVGSRGISNLELIVKEVVDFVRSHEAHPFIVPAMGSHGGATAEGQREVLASYGITEQNMGAPIQSSMKTVNIAEGKGSRPVYMDKLVYNSDGVILINKIKPHTDFHSKYESGLVKMSVIGLGKESGAKAIHHFGVHGLSELIPETAKTVFNSGLILAGVALVENAYDKTMYVKAIPGAEIMKEELKLLDIARENMPKLPVQKIDVLLIDQMGKNISGAGIDTNIIGRIKIFGQPDPEYPKIKSVVVRDLTDESHGNATGVGLADIITKKLYDKIDIRKTYKNIATSSFLERGKIPFVVDNDLEALILALRNCGTPEPGKERIIRIKDTLHLDEMYVSEAIYNEIKGDPEIEVLSREINLFNSRKMMVSF